MKKFHYKIFLTLVGFVFAVAPVASHSKILSSKKDFSSDTDDKPVATPAAVESNDSTDAVSDQTDASDKPATEKPKKKAKHKKPKAKPVTQVAPPTAKKFIMTKPERPAIKSATPQKTFIKVSNAPEPSNGFSPRLVTKDPAIKSRTVQITRVQGFDQIMEKLGFSQRQTNDLAARLARETEFIASRAEIGQKIILTEKIEDNKRKLLAMEIPTDTYTIQISKSRTGIVQITKRPNNNSTALDKTRYFYKQGQVKTTLSGLTSSLGVPSSINNFVNRIVSAKINAAKVAKGDRLELLYMYTYNNAGKQLGTKLLYLNLNSRAGRVEAYRFSPDKEDSPEFYDINGNSFSKSILSSPLRGKHKITSGFGYRSHPIFGHRMLHSGVDFGTKVGTPVYAAGDGTIEKVGRFGGYGNYIQIKHDDTWSTAYAHLSAFARGVSQWKRVKKGNLIAYTGNSGRSTGPHLHFELHQNGTPIDPLKAKLPVGGRKLIGRDLYSFRQEARRISNIIVQQKDTK